jgi:hypothetical protein
MKSGIGMVSLEFDYQFYKKHKKILLIPIDNNTRCVVEYYQVNNAEVQTKLLELRQKGWTLANIARGIGQSKRTVESWNQGKRSPANLQSVLISLDSLAKRKRIPQKKIYANTKKVSTADKLGPD